MYVLVSLFYSLFTFVVVLPPSEFVSAGFTIAQLFESFLGSENMNFVGYHMMRTTITVLVHSALPLGYVAALWCSGWESEWVPATFIAAALIPLVTTYKMVVWWEYERLGHPVAKTLLPYVTPGSDWRVVAADLNTEFIR